MPAIKKSIGIFALQGDFAEHKKILASLGADVFLIRDLSDACDRQIDGIILPGGESTTIIKMLKQTGLDKWLINEGKSGLPIFGTCAGMIVLANLGLINIEVERNAYGCQMNSFEDDIICEIKNKKSEIIKGIFIRAPKVKKVGVDVKVLAKYDKTPVLMRRNNIMVCSFHPELTNDTRIHEYLLAMK